MVCEEARQRRTSWTKASHDRQDRPVDAIMDVMRSSWDLPADCNEGELFAYAEMLFDRIGQA